jgi:hypothetical protein
LLWAVVPEIKWMMMMMIGHVPSIDIDCMATKYNIAPRRRALESHYLIFAVS